jgi:hypothetical protein
MLPTTETSPSKIRSPKSLNSFIGAESFFLGEAPCDFYIPFHGGEGFRSGGFHCLFALDRNFHAGYRKLPKNH